MKNMPPPKYANAFIDACAFDPGGVQQECSRRIIDKKYSEDLNLQVPHSVLKEIGHPNTPYEVKSLAAPIISTYETAASPQKEKRRGELESLIRGNAKSGQHQQDSDHIFELYKSGGGYFITTDKRLLALSDELHRRFQF